MAAQKRGWARWPDRDPRPSQRGPRLRSEQSRNWRQEAPDLRARLESGRSPNPSQLLALLRSLYGQAPSSPPGTPGQVYTILRGVRQALERATEPREVQPILDLVLQPAFLTQSLLGFIANLEGFCCQDGQLSQAVLGDTVAALHYLVESSPGHAQTLLCYPVDLFRLTIQRLQSRGFQFSWILQRQLHDLRCLLDKAFPCQGREGLVSVANRDNVCDIPVFPTVEDIFLEPTWKLKPNRISGSYKSDAVYLDTHFRLLREDMIKPLRDGISAQFSLRGLFSPSQKPSGELLLYRDVRLVRVAGWPAGVTYQVHLQTRRRALDPGSKRLQNGSLVCLIPEDCDQVFFGTVATTNRKDLQEEGAIWLHMQQGHTSLMGHFKTTVFLMVESPAFFEAYRHVLEGLQEMHADRVPFGRYIVQCCQEVSQPAYLLDKLAVFDLSALGPPRRKKDVLEEQKNRRTSFLLGRLSSLSSSFASRHSQADEEDSSPASDPGGSDLEADKHLVDLKAVSPFHDHLWTPKIFPGLDESQISAIQMALSMEFVLIQGPPGTGKTFIGLKILEILLDNHSHWDADHTPCLVVCYTNHALDQFLEGILKVHPKGVVRIGGRSKNEAVMQHALKNLRRWRFPSAATEKVLEELRRQKNSIAFSEEVLALLSKGVLTEKELRPEITRDHLQIVEGGMLRWLNVHPPQETDHPQDEQGWSNQKKKKERGNMKEMKPQLGQPSRMAENQADLHQNMRRERFLEEDEEDFDEFRPSASFKCKFAYIVPTEQRNSQNWLLAHLGEGDAMTDAEVARAGHVDKLHWKDRWRLYRRWVAAYEKRLKAALVEKLKNYEKEAAKLEEMNFNTDLEILRGSQVIGMTTTGAAKYRKLLQHLRPRIVIVEEAAEILEAHVLTALTTSCQHLILIGDHQQLRPKPADYTLEKKFHLGISLFERMILNQLPHVQLLYQHRMRPEISQLLVPFFYKELRDHAAVLDYEEIKGVEQNVFFVHHREEENHSTDSESYSNRHEAAFLVSLTRYLLKQGYRRSQITILSPYHGQVMWIRNLLRTSMEEEEENQGLRKQQESEEDQVAVHAVDDFQGEENDIVLLSLVRSNSEGKVGFLKDKNRLCVALSRAKKGFYCIGNMEHLSAHSTLWEEMVSMLKAKQLFGHELTLVCQSHPETKAAVKNFRDFSQVPSGGCHLKCQVRLACGHPCPRHCHPFDKEHSSVRCKLPCSKTLCELDHKCPKECWETCGLCQVEVEKVIPKCGHSQKVPCHVPEHKWICKEPCQKVLACGHLCKLHCGKYCEAELCKETIQVTLPCSHTEERKCFCRKNPLPCNVECQQKLACGHSCKGSCSRCLQGRLHAACQKKCTRVLLCSHVCQGTCCENCPPCKSRCPNWCQHSRCDKPCGDVCFPCRQPCTWRCEHYQCTRLCWEACDRPRCNQPCQKTLPCEHPCVGLCGEPCPPQCRECQREELTEIFFGEEDEPDSRFVLLEDCGHVFEVSGLDRWMDGEAGGARSLSIQQKVCPRCSTPIQCNSRYNNIIKETRQRIEEVKQKIKGSKEEFCAKQEAVSCALDKLPFSVRSKTVSLRIAMLVTLSLQSLRDWENTVNFLLAIQKVKDRAKECSVNRREPLLKAAEAVESWLCGRNAEEMLTSQQLQECQNEIRRLSYWANVLGRLSRYENKGVATSPEALAAVEEALGVLTRAEPFTEAQEGPLRATLETIDKLMPSSGLPLSESERVAVLEAMRFGQGHWYRCPQGHVYTIGECGRPMEESRCPECGATIGGHAHRLHADNAEFDPTAQEERLGDLAIPSGPLALSPPGSTTPSHQPGSPVPTSNSPSEAEGSPGRCLSIESLLLLDATSCSDGSQDEAAPGPADAPSLSFSPVDTCSGEEEEEAEATPTKD